MKKDFVKIISLLSIAAIIFAALSFFYKSKSEDSANPQTSSANKILIRDWSPRQGPAMAKVQVVEFLDPECESCRAMHPIVKRVLSKFENKILFVVRYMPFHKNSKLAASWLEAARIQGKYWQALDLLFARQPQWASHHNPRPELIPPFLQLIGVDIAKAKVDIKKQDISDNLDQDQKDGLELGVNGTPTFFVNGRMLERLSEAGLIAMIEAELE